MVAVLRLSTPKNPRKWGRRRRIFGEWRRFGDSRYLILTAETDAEGTPDWDTVRHTVDWGELQLLPTRTVTLPENGLPVFHGTALKQQLILHTAEYLLCALRGCRGGDRGRMTVGVYDPEGLWAEHLPCLLGTGAHLRVVTDAPEAYAQQQHQSMEQSGAAFPVGDNRTALSRCSLVLAPFGIEEIPSPRALVLSGVEHRHPQVADGYVPSVDPERLREIPSDCDAQLFLEAMYECGEQVGISAKFPTALHINGKIISIRDVLWRVAGLDIGISV